MEKEIINRVANSKLVTFDLEALYPKGERVVLDIKDWLFEGLLLREKEFRKSVAEHNWEAYTNQYVALTCSTDAIVPGWAFMLLASKLQPYAIKVTKGDLELLETAIYQELLQNLDTSPFVDKPVIIKGCSNKPVPENAYLMAVAKIQPVAKNVMYGEACSSVPLYKKR
ncbi:DUF2480 family protein [Allomuricauda sp. d1]|uniref:DUF2480 family protein n=1 Tax=Allomuricauda sp. d1 TaxID=3136725 RepID=UPI0031DC3A7E